GEDDFQVFICGHWVQFANKQHVLWRLHVCVREVAHLKGTGAEWCRAVSWVSCDVQRESDSTVLLLTISSRMALVLASFSFSLSSSSSAPFPSASSITSSAPILPLCTEQILKQINYYITQRCFKEHRHSDVSDLARRECLEIRYACALPTSTESSPGQLNTWIVSMEAVSLNLGTWCPLSRVMVSQNRLYSDSEEVVALQVFSEVIEMEGKEVQQPDMCEVKLLMSPDFQKLAQFTNIYPLDTVRSSGFPGRMMWSSLIHQTLEKDQLISHTTSQYPLKHTETTQEETAAPGKLPETPLRMDPDLLYDVRYDDGLDDRPNQPDQIQMETPPKEFISSYSAMCQWVEQVRERLRRFCSESLPLFFLVMWVVVIGVVGSAVIVKILDMFFPTCEHKHIFHLNAVTLTPEDEKHTLLENIEIEAEGEDKKP
ncbi:hypothetical protein INR49_004238, partial [Caranx melampygus]